MSCRSWRPSARETGMVFVLSTASVTVRRGDSQRAPFEQGSTAVLVGAITPPVDRATRRHGIARLSNGFQSRPVAEAAGRDYESVMRARKHCQTISLRRDGGTACDSPSRGRVM